MKAVFTCLITCFIFLLPAKAQKIYVSNGQSIKKVNVTTTGCVTDTVFFCPGLNFFTLAVHQNTFYFGSNTILYQATLTNDTITNCQPIDIMPAPMSSMTVDNNGVIYCASANALYTWDVNQGFVLLGAMPFASAGDMIFYKGELYMASLTGIIKVNINNPAASTMHIAMNSQAVYGMAAISVDCNENKVFAFETVNAGATSNMIELDLDNQAIVGNFCQIPYGVGDAASGVESGTFTGISLHEIKLLPECNNPAKGVIKVIREPGLATYTYTLNGTITNTTGVFGNLDPGHYTIQVTTPGGCLLDTTADLPLFNIVPPSILVHQQDPDCIGPGKVWYDINPDNGSYKIIYNGTDTVTSAYLFDSLGEGIHHFDLVDQYDCIIDSRNINLSLKGSCDTIFFPTGFTPNNDGRNDIFRGSGNMSIRNYKLNVFNRWGQLIYSTDNILKGWNGKFNTVEQPTGVYIWIATYTLKDGRQKMQKGAVALIR